MGIWGTGVFSDDTAADVRDDYRRWLQKGVLDEEATARVLEEWRDVLDDPDLCGVVWLALAATQWKLGRLEPHVRQRALSYIESGADLQRWDDRALARRRVRVLERLADQLRSPQRLRVKIRRPFVQQTTLLPGDAFAYRLRSGHLALFRVVEIYCDDLGGRAPAAELLDWSGVEPPAPREIERLRPRPLPTEWDERRRGFERFERKYLSGGPPTRRPRGPAPARFLLTRSSSRDDPAGRVVIVERELRFRDRLWPSDWRGLVVSWSELDDRLAEVFGLN